MPKSKTKAGGGTVVAVATPVADKETDWITALAKQTTEFAPSKEERVANRQAKRQRRQEHQQRKKAKTSIETNAKSKSVGQTPASRNNRQALLARHWRQEWESLTTMFRKRPYSPAVLTADRRPRNYPHAVQHRRIPITKVQQPRSKSAYGGLGLAQPTLFLAFTDPNWKALIVQDFGQHVAGWSGKPPMTKAMKKQRDSNLLWRRLQSAKQQQQQGTASSRKARKLKPPPPATAGDNDLQAWLDRQQLT